MHITAGWRRDPQQGRASARTLTGLYAGSSALISYQAPFSLADPEIAVADPDNTDLTSGTATIDFGTLGASVAQTYTYNMKNQLTNLGTTHGASPIANYAYTLDAVGRRLSVAELSGRIASYAHDGVYRLTSETISGAPSGPNGALSYTYDAVGNRTQLSSTLPGIVSQTPTYDPDDRLASDTYDSNGNTTLSGGIGNVYDFENHLIHHGGVTIVYDGDGNRVSKTVGGVTTKYLIDEKNPTGLPQVVEESV